MGTVEVLWGFTPLLGPWLFTCPSCAVQSLYNCAGCPAQGVGCTEHVLDGSWRLHQSLWTDPVWIQIYVLTSAVRSPGPSLHLVILMHYVVEEHNIE